MRVLLFLIGTLFPLDMTFLQMTFDSRLTSSGSVKSLGPSPAELFPARSSVVFLATSTVQGDI
jgi:hypothetical protein